MAVEQDLNALQGFIDETNESLQGIETSFLELEKEPENLDIINRIFRPVHSMKGNSGFFGLTHINKFAHQMEDLLDYIRRGQVKVTPDVIDILLTGIDYLQKMLNRVETDPSAQTELSDEEKSFLAEKVETCKPSLYFGTMKSVMDFEELLREAEDAGLDAIAQDFVNVCFDQIAKCNLELRKFIDKGCLSLSLPFSENSKFSYKSADHTATIKPVILAANSLAQGKALSAGLMTDLKKTILDLGDLLKPEPGAEELLDEFLGVSTFLDDELLVGNADYIDSTSKLIDSIVSFFEELPGEDVDVNKLGDILLEQKIISPEQLDNALKKQAKLGEILKESGSVSDEDLQKALSIQNKRTLKKHIIDKKKEKSKTIRIDQNKLDSFADAVGELYINVDSFNFLTKKFEKAKVDPDTMVQYSNNLTALDDMLSKLQDNVMSVRKVPVNTLFQRFPRVIRQLSSSLDKDIDFKLKGEDTVIDKDLLEAIENPLVHILRNSVDHGIEMPDARGEKNKSRQGILQLSASVNEYNVYLVIKDDGAGINPQKMKEIAVKKGFMTAQQVESLSDEELVNLIFKPGFSSAEKVSDVSGRGVGMDAVMAGLDQCGGRIHVDSVVDQGTTVTMTIPLTRTLVTKDALIVQSIDQFFAIPSEDITTTIYPDDSLVKLLDGESGISYNDRILRLVNADSFFRNIPSEISELGNEQVIVVCEKFEIALIVDRIFSHQQIVVKLFRAGYKQFQNIPGISGYTILGNEDIVLIIDLESIASEHIKKKYWE